MSWFSSLKTYVAYAEKDVLALVANIKQDVQIAESDINAALRWIAGNAGTITTDIQEVLGLVQIVGIANPQVEVAVTAANSAVGALNAFAAAYNSGTGTSSSVIAGYSAFKQAQAAAATATSIAVAATAAPAIPAPAPPHAA
jgi:hypothetical protein